MSHISGLFLMPSSKYLSEFDVICRWPPCGQRLFLRTTHHGATTDDNKRHIPLDVFKSLWLHLLLLSLHCGFHHKKKSSSQYTHTNRIVLLFTHFINNTAHSKPKTQAGLENVKIFVFKHGLFKVKKNLRTYFKNFSKLQREVFALSVFSPMKLWH